MDCLNFQFSYLPLTVPLVLTIRMFANFVCFFSALNAYFTIVVYSCYKTMLDEFGRGRILSGPAIIENKSGYPYLPQQDVSTAYPSYPVNPPPYTNQPFSNEAVYKQENEKSLYPAM